MNTQSGCRAVNHHPNHHQSHHNQHCHHHTNSTHRHKFDSIHTRHDCHHLNHQGGGAQPGGWGVDHCSRPLPLHLPLRHLLPRLYARRGRIIVVVIVVVVVILHIIIRCTRSIYSCSSSRARRNLHFAVFPTQLCLSRGTSCQDRCPINLLSKCN